MVITSVATHDDAATMARALVEPSLAACVQISKVESCYQWQGKLLQEQEFVLHIKTQADNAESLIKWLEQHHPYDTPEILSFTPQANDAYAQWLAQKV